MCLCEIYTEGSGATEEAREGEGIEPECADKRDYTENELKELQKKIRAAALQKFAHPDPQETEEQRAARQREADKQRGKAFAELLHLGETWAEV